MKNFLLLVLILLSSAILSEKLPLILSDKESTGGQRVFEDLKEVAAGKNSYTLDHGDGVALYGYVESAVVNEYQVTMLLVMFAAVVLVVSLIVLILGRRRERRSPGSIRSH